MLDYVDILYMRAYTRIAAFIWQKKPTAKCYTPESHLSLLDISEQVKLGIPTKSAFSKLTLLPLSLSLFLGVRRMSDLDPARKVSRPRGGRCAFKS